MTTPIDSNETEEEQLGQTDTPYDVSPPWTRTTKIIVSVFGLVLLALFVWRFSNILFLLVVSGLLTYLLQPIIIRLDRNTPLNRLISVFIVYLGMAVIIIIAIIALGVAAFDQIRNLIVQVPSFILNLIEQFSEFTVAEEPIIIGPLIIVPGAVPWDTIGQQALALVNPAVSNATQVITSLAGQTVSVVINIFFIFVLSIYFAIEAPRISGHLSKYTTPAGYQYDAEHLMRKIKFTWDSFWRGQASLAVIIFFADWLGLTILGVDNALALGIIGGLMEFIPTIGALIATVAAVTVAFFQTNVPWGLTNFQFALVVLIFMIVVQQIENNILVPKIVGDSLKVHPIIILLGVLIGGSIAGIIGAMLAAPIIATLLILLSYIWNKLNDLPPFPEKGDEAAKEKKRPWYRRLRDRFSH